MVKYEELDYDDFSDYLVDFLKSVLTTNHTFNYFVNWDKVFGKVNNNRTEIFILNSLCKVDEINLEEEFKKIIIKYPEVVPVLPSILAIRFKKNNKYLDILDEEYMQVETCDFDKDNFNIDVIVKFSKQTGLLNLFNKIDNLYAYLVGTEVGLDTNARKNRSGTNYENLIETLLNRKLNDLNRNFGKELFTLKSQDYVQNISRRKRADFIIYKNNQQKYIIECNFYNSTGSKPIEVASAYQELQEELSLVDLNFIWITDGSGWLKMVNTLKNVCPDIDYILNYNMLKDNFEKIIGI
ncbi:MAG: type II restriction endonuclease [Methanobrevibacter sp.]